MEKEVSTKPGIYCFTNSVNGKCYVGQALNLRRRFNKHINNFKTSRYDNPLYRAFAKYGLEKFNYNVLEIIEDELDQTTLKEKLDILEIKYISEKDSYSNGYNQTKGGDGGITGYKFSEEQKRKLSENTKKVMADGRYTIFVYDKQKDKFYEFANMKEAAINLNVNADSIRNSKKYNRWYLGRYLFGEDKELLKEKILTVEINVPTEQYLEEYYNYLKQFNVISIKQVSEDLGITEEAVKKRNQKLRNLGYTDLPFKSHNKIKYIEVTNIIDNIVTNYTIKELSILLNIEESSVRKQIKRHNVYKNKYKFNTIYE